MCREETHYTKQNFAIVWRKVPEKKWERGAPRIGPHRIRSKRRSADQREELIDGHFYARYGQRQNPENDQNQAEKGPVMRPARLVMNQCHETSSQVGSNVRLKG